MVGLEGVSDLELMARNLTIFIEMKLPGKTQSEEQKDFEQCAKELGHIYVVIYTLEQFKNFVKSILNG